MVWIIIEIAARGCIDLGTKRFHLVAELCDILLIARQVRVGGHARNEQVAIKEIGVMQIVFSPVLLDPLRLARIGNQCRCGLDGSWIGLGPGRDH